MVLLFLAPPPSPKEKKERERAEAHCLWRSATVRCPITSRAPRSHRHRALHCGAEIAHGGSGGTTESTEGSLQTERGKEFNRSTLSCDTAQLRIYHLQLIFPPFYFLSFYTLLSGTRRAASLLIDERELGTSLGKTKHFILDCASVFFFLIHIQTSHGLLHTLWRGVCSLLTCPAYF